MTLSIITNDPISFFSLFVSILSLGVMIWLWFLQDKEAKDSKKILKNTESLTKKIETDSEFNKNVLLFFKYKDNVSKTGYKIIYPAEYVGKPLPLIHQGDFYAIHVISLALGLRNIQLKDIKKLIQNCKDDNNNRCTECEGNIIYICSPQSNPCLDHNYPYANKIECKYYDETRSAPAPTNLCCKKEKNRYNYNHDFQSQEWLTDIGLPCWFINHIKESDIKGQCISIKKIQTTPRKINGNFQSPIKSSADFHYENAEKRPGEVYEAGVVSDIGILSRISKKTGTDIIISGIHQYGTWIVADFLNRLLRSKEIDMQKKEKEQMLEQDDFIAIIEGFFDSSSLDVNRGDTKILELWLKDTENNWKLFDD